MEKKSSAVAKVYLHATCQRIPGTSTAAIFLTSKLVLRSGQGISVTPDIVNYIRGYRPQADCRRSQSQGSWAMNNVLPR